MNIYFDMKSINGFLNDITQKFWKIMGFQKMINSHDVQLVNSMPYLASDDARQDIGVPYFSAFDRPRNGTFLEDAFSVLANNKPSKDFDSSSRQKRTGEQRLLFC